MLRLEMSRDIVHGGGEWSLENVSGHLLETIEE